MCVCMSTSTEQPLTVRSGSNICQNNIANVNASMTQRYEHHEKPMLCICENKDADQLHDYREADQRLCFRYIDSAITLLSKSEILSL